MYFSTALTMAGLATSASAGYSLRKNYMDDFFGSFDFFTADDPTHGFVNYVDSGTALSSGLASSNDGIYIGVDYQNGASGRGRNSVRLESKDNYNQALIILDLAHMPGSIPGIWPAFWTYGPNWPNNGEIDIIEGVNRNSVNQMTIHSGNPACKMESSGDASLPIHHADCYYLTDGNEGCSYVENDGNSYGDGFNAAGGGVFAMEHAGDVISIWRFGRNDDLSNVLGANPDPKTWGKPRSSWLSTANGGCDLKKEINTQRIVFDTTFCGDWAGAVYEGGPEACKAFVRDNPAQFREAFWKVNSLKVFTTDGQSALYASPPPAAQPTTTEAPIASSQTSTSSSETSTSAASTTNRPPPPPATTETSTSTSETSTITAPSSDLPPPPAPESTTEIVTSATSAIETSSVPAAISTTDIISSTATSTTEVASSSSSSSTSEIQVTSALTATDLPASPSITSTAEALPTTSDVPTTTSEASISAVEPTPKPSTSPVNEPTSTSSQPTGTSSGRPNRSGRRHRHSRKPTATADQNKVQATPTHVPWSVVVNPDGTVSEIQEPQANSKRNVPPRKHTKHFMKTI